RSATHPLQRGTLLGRQPATRAAGTLGHHPPHYPLADPPGTAFRSYRRRAAGGSAGSPGGCPLSHHRTPVPAQGGTPGTGREPEPADDRYHVAGVAAATSATAA